jgi:ComF family protein
MLHEIAQRDTRQPYASAIKTLLPYRNRAVKALIYELKYRQHSRALTLAADLLCDELLGAAEEHLGVPLLIPVPMHPDRRRVRGYNQTELLCEQIAAQLPSVAYAPLMLERIRAGVPQQKLTRVRRLANMRGAMRAHAQVRGRICIVVDDVSTTGATLLECRRALLQAKARAVCLLALAG